MKTLISQSQNPFAQARYMAITQLAVFEAVNAITARLQAVHRYRSRASGRLGRNRRSRGGVQGAQDLLPGRRPARHCLRGVAGIDTRRFSQDRRHRDRGGGGCPNDRAARRGRFIPPGVLPPGVDRARRVADHAELSCRRWNQFPVAKHQAVRSRERPGQPRSLVRFVHARSAAGSRQHQICKRLRRGEDRRRLA